MSVDHGVGSRHAGGRLVCDRLDVVRRGVWMGTCAGLALGGVAGTVDWPVVGTFFAGIEGAVAGTAAGLSSGFALSLIAGRSRSHWRARATAGCIAALAAAGVWLSRAGRVDVPGWVAVGLVIATVLIGAALGPLIAFGVDPTTAAGLRGLDLQRHFVLGAASGAGLGAVLGLVVGLFAYLPTAPVAAVEGAVLGSVCGLVLAALVIGCRAVPRLRAGR